MNFRPSRAGADEPRIEITPLIDVVFLLLIFFLLTTTFVAERTIDVDLPESSASAVEAPAGEDLVVVVTEDGRLYHAGTALDLGDLSRRFEEAAKADPETKVVLKADRGAAHGRVVEVMERARDAGLTHLSILTADSKGR